MTVHALVVTAVKAAIVNTNWRTFNCYYGQLKIGPAKSRQNTLVYTTMLHLSKCDLEDSSDPIGGPVFDNSDHVVWNRHIS